MVFYKFVGGFSYQVIEGWVHGIQVVAAVPVLDPLHGWVVRIEPLVQVLGGNILFVIQILEIKCDSRHLIYELSCSGKFWADPQLIYLWGCKLAFLIKFYMVTIVTFQQAGFSEFYLFQKFLYCADSPFTELVFLSWLA